MKRKEIRGFTLIELMIVVVIIGILAGIAYPSYTEHVRHSRRADAKSVLLEGAQFMERLYTERGAYNWKKSGANYVTASTLEDLGFPANLQKAPKDGGTVYYNITLDGDLLATNFKLKATPTGAQASDRCGVLTINQAGAKDVVLPAGSSATLDTCWNR